MEEIGIEKFPAITTLNVKDQFIHDILQKKKQRKLSFMDLYDLIKDKIPFTFTYFKSILKLSFPEFRNKEVLINICEILGIKKEILESEVVAYRTRQGRVIAYNPSLPIKVSPMFYMLIAHLMADGCYIRFKDRKSIYSKYRQYNKKLRLSFLDKADNVFGNLTYPRTYFDYETLVYLPEIPSLLLLNYTGYPTEKFLSRRARIPEHMLDSSRKHLVAILTAFTIDEGNIDSAQICIYLMNKGLISDLSKICKLLGYPHTIGKRKNKMFGFYILKDGLKLFWKDYQDLKKDYPFLTMDYKEDAIKKFIKRKEKYWCSKGKNQTKNEIIRVLKEEDLTAKEIGYRLGLSRQGARYHLVFLRKKGIVKRIKIRRGWTYRLVRDIRLSESKKGISRQEGSTVKRILNILNGNSLSSYEISEILKIPADSIRFFMNKLEKEGKVLRAWKERVDVCHYTIMWELNLF